MNTPFAGLVASLLISSISAVGAADKFASHAPMRPLPEASVRPMPAEAVRYVDAAKGSDAGPGTKEQPWKTLKHSIAQLKPGDTLSLRGGMYYENVTLPLQGTAEKPITIRGQQGELAIIDAGYREFLEDPANAWEPYPQGAAGEYRSTKSYAGGGGFGNFADSMIPFHRYMNFIDLRSANEFWRAGLENRQEDPVGIYCGPGTRRDPETGRIHIRLAHTELAGLGENAYRGETDPRKLPLVIIGDAEYAVAIIKAQHLRLQDVVVRGAKTALKIESAGNIELDGVTLYGGSMAMRLAGVDGLRVVDSALRGHAAPWHSRFHHKNRAGSGYLILAEAECRNFDLSRSEFTDHHDFFAFHNVDELRFHENYVDNFNDDAFEPGAKRERGRIYIYQNYVSRCLSPLTAHANKPNPVESEPGSGIYLYRNIFDFRRGTYKRPPETADPSGAYLDESTDLIAHDHGNPIHAVAYVYQNTFLMKSGAFRGYYAFTWGAHTHGTTRRIFNNIFVQVDGVPGLNATGIAPEDDFVADGNLYWSVREGGKQTWDFFEKFRQLPIVAASKQRYAPGLGAGDRFGDPQFVSLGADGGKAADLRLAAGSAAVGGGVAIPAEWPDPLRAAKGIPTDMGALPRNAEAWGVGVRGRISISGDLKKGP